MVKSEFFRQSLRITVMQILRGIGFDRAPPHLIDILTDLYIRHLLLLTSEAQSLSQLCGRDEVVIQDITQALVNVGMLKPSNILDAYEMNYAEDQSAKPFLNWVVGHVTENQRTISRPNPVESVSKKVDQQSQLGGTSNLSSSVNATQRSEEEVEEDWLSFHIKQSGKLGNEKMFDVTELRPDNVPKGDYVIAGPTPDGLHDKLPTSLKMASDALERELFTQENDEEVFKSDSNEYQHFAAQFDNHGSSTFASQSGFGF